jgi:hypothetical protein
VSVRSIVSAESPWFKAAFALALPAPADANLTILGGFWAGLRLFARSRRRAGSCSGAAGEAIASATISQ